MEKKVIEETLLLCCRYKWHPDKPGMFRAVTIRNAVCHWHEQREANAKTSQIVICKLLNEAVSASWFESPIRQ